MNRWIVAAVAVVALGGCKAKTHAPAPAASPAAEATAPAASPTSQAAPGTYDVTAKDGTKSTTTIMADGTYEDKDAAGKTTTKGKWNSPADMVTCFIPDGGKKACYTESRTAPDGTFTATPDDNTGMVTVKKRP